MELDPGAEVIQVIRTRLLRRGSGRQDNPVRIIEQYWTLDGKVLAEVDPDASRCACVTGTTMDTRMPQHSEDPETGLPNICGASRHAKNSPITPRPKEPS